MNQVRLEGQCAAPADSRRRRNGTVAATRLLVEVRQPDRTDILPVVVWNPQPSVQALEKGDPVKVEGQLRRRFINRRESRIEVTVVQDAEAPTEGGVNENRNGGGRNG